MAPGMGPDVAPNVAPEPVPSDLFATTCGTTTMTERRVEVSGGRLAVLDFGSGPPVVLLHAGIVDSWAWEPLTPFLLAAGYRVVAFDRRGSGGSVTEDVPFSNRADVLAVMDALGIGRAALIGASVGGTIALDTAVEFPERVVAVVTVGATLGGYEVEPTAEEAAIFAEMDRLEEAGDPAAVADFEARVWVDGPGQPPDRVPAEIRELVREMALEVARARSDPGRAMGRAIRLDPPAAQRLDRLVMPVLAIAGGLDVSDVPTTARYLAEQLPAGRALIMPAVAHMIGLEAPEELARSIVDFLAPLDRWK